MIYSLKVKNASEYIKDHIFELSHETFDKDMIDPRSYVHNLSSCEIKAWKKFRLEWNCEGDCKGHGFESRSSLKFYFF